MASGIALNSRRDSLRGCRCSADPKWRKLCTPFANSGDARGVDAQQHGNQSALDSTNRACAAFRRGQLLGYGPSQAGRKAGGAVHTSGGH